MGKVRAAPPQLKYSINELAEYLLRGKPFPVNHLLSDDDDMELERWKKVICDHIEDETLIVRGKRRGAQLKINIRRGNSYDSSAFNERFIYLDELIKWSDIYFIELWPDVIELRQRICGKSQKTSTIETPTAEIPEIQGGTSIDSHEIEEIKKLLAGTHNKQAPELRLAINYWLQFIDDPAINDSNVKKVIKERLEEDLSKAEADRISTTINWNKGGNNAQK